jgi:hypothetical protein
MLKRSGAGLTQFGNDAGENGQQLIGLVQVSVLTIDTTATPPAPAEPFGVAEWKWLMVES